MPYWVIIKIWSSSKFCGAQLHGTGFSNGKIFGQIFGPGTCNLMTPYWVFLDILTKYFGHIPKLLNIDQSAIKILDSLINSSKHIICEVWTALMWSYFFFAKYPQKSYTKSLIRFAVFWKYNANRIWIIRTPDIPCSLQNNFEIEQVLLEFIMNSGKHFLEFLVGKSR